MLIYFQVFTEVLKGRFKDVGLNKIKRGEWLLENHHAAQFLISRSHGTHL